MTEEHTSKQPIENDELICPITLQLFYDPVKAKDGHVYERKAITTWILQHGTSPLTRQPLQIYDLQSDDRLKNLARQRRNSTVSYNSYNEQIIFPPIKYVIRNNNQIIPQVDNQTQVNLERRNFSNVTFVLVLFIAIILPLSLILGIVIGLKD